MTTEFTASGFQRDNLTTLIEQQREALKVKFGNQLSVAEDSVANQFAVLTAERLDYNYQLLEAAIASQTLAGAESTYLDDILGKYIPRLGKQPATGNIFLETDNTTPNNFTFPASTNLNGAGNIFRTDEDVLLTEVVQAYTLSSDQMVSAGIGSYEYTIKDPSTNGLVSQAFNLTSVADLSVIDAFLKNIRDFIINNNADTSDSTFVIADTEEEVEITSINAVTDNGGIARFQFTPGPTLTVGQDVTLSGFLTYPSYNLTGQITDAGAGYFEISSISYLGNEIGGSFSSTEVTVLSSTLYSGYNSDLVVVGWQEATEFRSSPVVGSKFNRVNVSALTPGFNPVPPYTEFSLAPSFTGLQSATNPEEFASGSNVETDAEYTARYFSLINRISSCTRDAIADAVLSLEGVEAARIYPNPSSENSIQKTECSASDSGTGVRFSFSRGREPAVSTVVNISGFQTNLSYNGSFTVSAVGPGYFDVDSLSYGTAEAGGEWDSELVIVAADTFNTVVIGGISNEINQAIYDTKPIGAATEQITGNITTIIDTADGSTEEVSHTAGIDADVDLQISYQTENNQALSDSEQTQIITNLVDLGAALTIGNTLYNIRAQTAVLNGVTNNRITTLSVNVKRTSEVESFYGATDFVPNYNELVVIESSNIFFDQVL